eukprot:TRINITY_DN775890_c0_g1_i1.p1 TRINITY_DN775890_c0_g1~~TRINITY_DN775890_c0_g1_i1.p1  ORF type:complete len:281 (+),score=37.97 TRINITY_DN775890_c0_g1_i1:93-935(+)
MSSYGCNNCVDYGNSRYYCFRKDEVSECLTGNEIGPYNDARCDNWITVSSDCYATSLADSCYDYTNCNDCRSGSNCIFCNGSTCLPADSSGDKAAAWARGTCISTTVDCPSITTDDDNNDLDPTDVVLFCFVMGFALFMCFARFSYAKARREARRRNRDRSNFLLNPASSLPTTTETESQQEVYTPPSTTMNTSSFNLNSSMYQSLGIEQPPRPTTEQYEPFNVEEQPNSNDPSNDPSNDSDHENASSIPEDVTTPTRPTVNRTISSQFEMSLEDDALLW